MSKEVAVITGVAGQAGSYLSELCLSNNLHVVGMVRRCSNRSYENIQHLIGNPDFEIVDGDVSDFSSIASIVSKYKPKFFFNIAGQSFVAASWTEPIATLNTNTSGVANCLESIRLFSPKTKFYQASTSEVYGDVQNKIQDENTPARPRSPYAASKYAAESLVKTYRDSYGIFACFTRNFNFESPRRGREFVTRKITNWIGQSFNAVDDMIAEWQNNTKKSFKISNQDAWLKALNDGKISKLKLGNIDSMRDWTHCRDTVLGMYLTLQQDKPDDFVLATGEVRSVRDFLAKAFSFLGIDDWTPFVEIDSSLFRPADVNFLCGNASKAKEKLGWTPTVSFHSLVSEMVDNDIELSIKHKYVN